MIIGIIMVILGSVVGALSWRTKHLPSLLIAVALVVAGLGNANMAAGEWLAFALIILVGLVITWPKHWARVRHVRRQWIVGAVVLLLTILMVWLPDNLFGNVDGLGWLILFIAAVVFALASAAAMLIATLLMAVVLFGGNWLVQLVSSSAPAPSPSIAITSTTPSLSPSATAASSTTPSPSPSATATSATPSPTADKPDPAFDIPLEAMVTNNVVTNWKELDSLADPRFKKIVNRSMPDSGTMGKAKTWKSPAKDARLVVVFAASTAEISDKRARRLAGVGSKTVVNRAGKCYAPYGSFEDVCPKGDQRVMLMLAPTIKVFNGEPPWPLHGWGVAIFDTDEGIKYWPVDYE